jgi:PhnB protein
MTTSDKSADAAAIRALIDKRAEALRAKDAEGVVSGQAPEIVSFTLAPPLRQMADKPRAREGLKAWFATWSGPLGYEMRDPSITVGGDVAFCLGLVRISGTKTNGKKEDVWARQTLCLERLGGAWKVVHEHTSVPFYMDGSVKAAVDLKP